MSAISAFSNWALWTYCISTISDEDTAYISMMEVTFCFVSNDELTKRSCASRIRFRA